MRLPAILATAAALALPGAAAAKEVTALDVCGTDGCTRIADRAVLRGFEQGSELAQAPPAGPQRPYVVRVRVRDDAGASRVGWTTLWLPAAGVMASDDGQPGATFMPVGPVLDRALRRAARGHRARAARTFAAPAPPTARVAEVVPAPAPAAAQSGSSHRPALAGVGLAAILVLIVAGAWRARRS